MAQGDGITCLILYNLLPKETNSQNEEEEFVRDYVNEDYKIVDDVSSERATINITIVCFTIISNTSFLCV